MSKQAPKFTGQVRMHRPDQDLFSALGGIRTPNLLIRSQMLYPLSYERRASKSLTCPSVRDEIAPTGTLPAAVRRTLDRSNRPCRELVSTFTSTRCDVTAGGQHIARKEAAIS